MHVTTSSDVKTRPNAQDRGLNFGLETRLAARP